MENRMPKNIALLAVLAALPALLSPALAQKAGPKAQIRASHPADTDKDGHVSKEEYFAALRSSFKLADKDNSGKLESNECKKGWCRAADANKDKAVTEDEYIRRAEQDFKAADGNADGKLSEKERRGVVIFRF